MPLQVLEVVFESSTKSKALHKAIENTSDGFDAAVVFDIDNIAAPDFLYQINNYLQAGNRVVQGHRVAKNTNTPIAVLDAISEEVNNHIFRKSQRVFNLSAAIIGSGMALEYKLFKEVMLQIDAVGGFDKEMGLLLTRNNIGVAYAEDALIYDEKGEQPRGVLKNKGADGCQLSSIYLKSTVANGLAELFKHGNFDYFNEIYQTAILTRYSFNARFNAIYAADFIVFNAGHRSWLVKLWFIATGCCYTGILVAVPASFL